MEFSSRTPDVDTVSVIDVVAAAYTVEMVALRLCRTDVPASGINTFLFSDIENSTRQWREHSNMADLLARHDDLLRLAIASARGRWTKHTGDGALAVFAHPSDAIEAAVDIQRRLESDDELPLRVRIGVHSGEATRREDDYFGLAVSAAAQRCGAGSPTSAHSG